MYQFFVVASEPVPIQSAVDTPFGVDSVNSDSCNCLTPNTSNALD